MGCTASNPSINEHVSARTTPAFSNDIGGTIKIESRLETKLISCEWCHNGNAALLELSPNRTRAYNVPSGLYEIQCTLENKPPVALKVEVQQLAIPTLQNYIVTHASGDMCRDGAIEAEFVNLNEQSVQYLWTSGVRTERPVLYDVQPGVYAVTLLSSHSTHLAVPFYHNSQLAVVDASKHK